MQFESGNYYHIYNRGINRCTIFYRKSNYYHFIVKIKRYISPHCSIVAWCLMPNHFHLLIYADDRSELKVNDKSGNERNILCEGVRLLLSSYAKSLNKQQDRVGNLFQQRTKGKLLVNEFSSNRNSYVNQCFEYIHHNPVKAGLVEEQDQWEFSSYHEYIYQTEISLCDNLFIANRF